MQWSRGQLLFPFPLKTAEVLLLSLSMLAWVDQLELEPLEVSEEKSV